MEQLVLIKSKNNNKYIFDCNNKILRNVEDQVYNIFEILDREKTSLNSLDLELLETILANHDINPSVSILSKILKFNSENNTQFIKTTIKEDVVKYYLSNYPQIAFEVTQKCNLDCKYCAYSEYYNGYEKRTGKNLSITAAKNMIKYIFDYCSSIHASTPDNHITISFYGGEPLLRINFIKEITSFAKNLETINIKFKFSMTTNATLIDKHIDFLVKNDFKLLISLDGNEEHNSYRVYKNKVNSFSDVFRNMISIKQNYQTFFEKNINFNCVLHNRNSIESANSFIKKNFGKNPMIAEISTDGLSKEKKEELFLFFKNKNTDLKQSEDYFKLFHQENYTEEPDFKEAIYFIFNQTNLVYSNYTELLLNSSKSVKPTGTCLPFSRKIFVTANGKLLPCENIPHKFAFGNVTDENVNLNFEEIVNTYNNALNRLKNKCEGCYRLTNCSQCMYYLNVYDENIMCYGYMNRDDFSKYLSSLITYFENNPDSFEKIMTETSLS